MATIKAIEGRSVHQIQSGQVIVDLCSVVKELVENSLDAGATSIDVRFKNNGLDSIEVQDNGEGIAPADYETIALKHYTSKLSTYDDLGSLQTFGFRGEALSSLCALSHFHVITARASDGPKGTRLDFETSGKLKGTSVTASQKGTTVAVETLFYNLPVRRRELEKNIKREYGKVLGLLHAYACISTGVRFAVSNQAAKGKKVVVFSTKANPTTRENIVNVYGSKTLSALIPLDLALEMYPTTVFTQSTKNWSTHDDAHSRDVRIQGHISRPVVGEGRQTPDRQMFFVNSRPCALPQVSKAVNEVYKSYNVTQSPFIFANLLLDTNAYDVNVSPDKRTILLHDQTALLEALKDALVKLFEEHDQSVPHAQLGARKLSQYKPLNLIRQSSTQEGESLRTESPTRGNKDEDMTSSDAPLAEAAGQKGTPVSLIQQFVGSDATSRSQIPARRPSGSRSREVSPDKQKIPHALQKLDMQEKAGHIEDNNTTIMDVDSSPPRSPVIPQAVQDFNKRMASLETKAHPERPEPSSRPAEEEENIAAIQPSSQRKGSPRPVINAFERMRPKRAPAETATITIGNRTTTMTIGTTPSNKRRKIHTPKYDLNGGLLPSPGKKSQFVSGLRAFAAPGTQASEASDMSDEDDIEDEEQQGTQEEESDVEETKSNTPVPDAEALKKAAQQRMFPEDSDAESDEAVPTPIIRAKEQLPRDDSPLFVQQDERVEPVRKEVQQDDGSDDEYLDEEGKKAQEEARVAEMIAKAEEAATRPTHDNLRRATNTLKGGQRKNSTLRLVQYLDTSVRKIEHTLSQLTKDLQAFAEQSKEDSIAAASLADQTAEEHLSLTVSKSDFGRMRVIGQFNLGFILAVRPASSQGETTANATSTATSSRRSTSDELFIVDQHASDEKINFERLTNNTILAPQRLVHPLPLDLTAIEEETILAHPAAFAANGFMLSTDTSGDAPVGKRCRLLGLPVSKETTFTLSDLEELVALINETALSTDKESSIPRPGKVRRMLAMRACRSSIMIGKTLTHRQMQGVLERMGEIDKPWNCPHGRPTMRHLASLAEWEGWKEGDGVVGVEETERAGSGRPDWGSFLAGKRDGGVGGRG